MPYAIEYYNEDLQQEILELPPTLLARYISLADRMINAGPNLGEPHTKAFGKGLFELRLKGAESIARVFFCTRIGQRELSSSLVYGGQKEGWRILLIDHARSQPA